MKLTKADRAALVALDEAVPPKGWTLFTVAIRRPAPGKRVIEVNRSIGGRWSYAIYRKGFTVEFDGGFPSAEAAIAAVEIKLRAARTR